MTGWLLLSEASGWAIAGLTAVTVGLPYLIRARFPVPAAYVERLRPHYWIGFTIAGLSLLHAGFAMSSGGGPPDAGWTVGIWVAMGAMLLVFGQVSLGLGLSRPLSAPERRRRRRLHVLTMAALVVAGAAHLVLDGPVTRLLLAPIHVLGIAPWPLP